MIGSGLKKLAKENGMTIFGGVAYGSLRGYASTLSEGVGYKKLDFAVTFANLAEKEDLRVQLAGSNLRSVYRVTNFSFSEKVIQVTFHDTVGTMKKIRAFLDFFIPLLDQHGAARSDICAECGGQLMAPVWAQVNGICYPMHESCAQSVRLALDDDNARLDREKTGSYLTGTLGALAGAVLGGLVWGLVLKAGYMASLVGMFIGWLAEVGYRLAKGRQGKAKSWILAAAVLLAVMLGTFVPELLEIGSMILDGCLPGFHLWELPVFILALLVENHEFRAAVAYNLGMGLLFAFFGVFLVLQKTAQEVSGVKFRYMK